MIEFLVPTIDDHKIGVDRAKRKEAQAYILKTDFVAAAQYAAESSLIAQALLQLTSRLVYILAPM